MRKSEASLEEILVVGMVFDVWVYFATLVLRSTAIRHAVTFIGVVFVWLIILRKLITQPMKKCFIFGMLSLLIIMALNLFNGKVALFNYLYSSLCYLSFFVIMSTDSNYKLTGRIRKYVKWMIILISITIAALSFSPVAYLFEDGRTNGAMALGTTNSNLAGILVFLVYSIVQILQMKSKRKVPYLFLLAFLLYVVWMTRSRSSFLATMVVTACCLFRHKPFRKWQIEVCMWIPVVFVAGYLWLYKSPYAHRMASFIGKPLFSGREITYILHLQNLKSVFQILFGNIPGLYFSNAHNGPLVILCNLGLVGFCVSYYCIARQLIMDNRKIQASSSNSIGTIVTILAVFILSCGEGSIFMGVFPGVALVLLVKALA